MKDQIANLLVKYLEARGVEHAQGLRRGRREPPEMPS